MPWFINLLALANVNNYDLTSSDPRRSHLVIQDDEFHPDTSSYSRVALHRPFRAQCRIYGRELRSTCATHAEARARTYKTDTPFGRQQLGLRPLPTVPPTFTGTSTPLPPRTTFALRGHRPSPTRRSTAPNTVYNSHSSTGVPMVSHDDTTVPEVASLPTPGPYATPVSYGQMHRPLVITSGLDPYKDPSRDVQPLTNDRISINATVPPAHRPLRTHLLPVVNTHGQALPKRHPGLPDIDAERNSKLIRRTLPSGTNLKWNGRADSVTLFINDFEAAMLLMDLILVHGQVLQHYRDHGADYVLQTYYQQHEHVHQNQVEHHTTFIFGVLKKTFFQTSAAAYIQQYALTTAADGLHVYYDFLCGHEYGGDRSSYVHDLENRLSSLHVSTYRSGTVLDFLNLIVQVFTDFEAVGVTYTEDRRLSLLTHKIATPATQWMFQHIKAQSMSYHDALNFLRAQVRFQQVLSTGRYVPIMPARPTQRSSNRVAGHLLLSETDAHTNALSGTGPAWWDPWHKATAAIHTTPCHTVPLLPVAMVRKKQKPFIQRCYRCGFG